MNTDIIKEKGSIKFMQVVCFKLEEEEYAFDILHIKEVIHLNRITYIPQMPEFVIGVINIRGTIVPVLDLRKKFRLKHKDETPDARIIVTIVNIGMIGLIVDKVLENTLLTQDQIDPIPSVSMAIDKECIMGIGKIEGRMITILDIEKVHSTILNDIKNNSGI